MNDRASVGIDLGTTHSLIAHLDHGRPKIIPNHAGELLTPSVVACDPDGRILLGQTASDYGRRHPERVATGFKRLMGTEGTLKLGGRTWTPIELSSLILGGLKEDAERALGVPVGEAVVTVPAYFDSTQREATRAAAELAGLEVSRLLNEPTAAALAHGLLDASGARNIVVLDWGGGTFDVSVLRSRHGLSEVVASAGEAFLGGEDVTESLATWLAKQAGLEPDEWLVSRLLPECERIKRTLSEQATTTASLAAVATDRTGIVITRDVLTEVAAPLWTRISGVMERAMSDAGLDSNACDALLLAGGATRMPQFRALAEEFFGRIPVTKLSPDTVVAMGAAVQAGVLEGDSAVEDVLFTDVLPWSLGVEITKEMGGHGRNGYFAPVIHRNTTIPCSREEVFATVYDRQTSVRLNVLQGESRYAADNLSIATLDLLGIPSGKRGTPITVRFTYDISGLLEIESFADGAPTIREVVVHRPRHVSPESLDAARLRLAQVRFFPRDQEANVGLLAAGVSALEVIHPDRREEFELVLDEFEGALWGHDPELFGAVKRRLDEALAALD